MSFNQELLVKNSILSIILLSAVVSFPMAKADAQVAAPSAITLNNQSVYYVSSNSVVVRSTADKTGKVLGELSLNDEIKVINPTVITNNLVEVKIVLSYDKVEKAEKYFVNASSLAPKIIDYKEFVGKYFVVVNVATETLRLYERVCSDNSCPNKMILETEVVVGEDINHPKEAKGKGRSILGSYRVTGWAKFYQDPDGHYPSWYKDGYPETPKSDAKWLDWFSKKVMPINDEGKRHGVMRGAFGWFTAFAAPEPFGQWTHGTLGWGSDKDKFIKETKKTLINIITNPRSSGCTRNNNEAIAFLRKMVSIGTPMIKIYSKEELLDPSLRDYPNLTEEWKYVMTKNKNHSVDREDVLKNLGVTSEDVDTFLQAKDLGGGLILDPSNPLNQILETGTYLRDVHPDVIPYTPGENMGRFGRKLGRKGNVYGIVEKQMHGVFYVDAGMLEGYAHPDTVLESSGFADEMTPPWMERSNLK